MIVAFEQHGGLGEEAQRDGPEPISGDAGETTRRQLVEGPVGFSGHAEFGIREGETRTPYAVGVVALAEEMQDRAHLGEASLFAADHEHQEAVDPALGKIVVGQLDLGGGFHLRLRFLEVTVG